MVDAVGTADASPLFTDEEKAVVTASTELTKTARLSASMFERLKRHFDEHKILELVINTSIANLNNRVTDSFQADVEPDE